MLGLGGVSLKNSLALPSPSARAGAHGTGLSRVGPPVGSTEKGFWLCSGSGVSGAPRPLRAQADWAQESGGGKLPGTHMCPHQLPARPLWAQSGPMVTLFSGPTAAVGASMRGEEGPSPD